MLDTPDPRDDRRSSVVLLVETRAGYPNLCRLITRGRRLANRPCAATVDDVCEHAAGLVALWRGEPRERIAP